MMLMAGIPRFGWPSSQCTPPSAVICGVSASEGSLPFLAGHLEVVGTIPSPSAQAAEFPGQPDSDVMLFFRSWQPPFLLIAHVSSHMPLQMQGPVLILHWPLQGSGYPAVVQLVKSL